MILWGVFIYFMLIYLFKIYIPRKWLLKLTLNEDLLNFDSKNILHLKNTDKSDFVIENFNKIVKIEKYDTIADEMAALVAKYTDSLDLEEVNRVVASFKPANPIMANAWCEI